MTLRVLLDTCALIFTGEGLPLSARAKASIAVAITFNVAFISPVSAWELGMLARPRSSGPRKSFDPDVETWFARFTNGTYTFAPLTHEIALASSFLPGPLHDDPADRMLIATARHLGAALVTSDRKILAYAEFGHIDAIKL